VTNFWVISFFENWPKFFLQHLKNKIIINFEKFVATKKGLTTTFFPPLSFVAVFGSGIRDPKWVKVRIRDKHPGSATLEKLNLKT
jgi:hypothetical protein